MKCRNPYVNPKGVPFGCGQCLPCRINRRRLWAARIMYEASQHQNNTFLTLTYNTENMPLTEHGVPNLNKKHLTDFVKLLRYHLQPTQIRYYGVGEYGSKYGRPHYHLAVFGLPGCLRQITNYDRRGYCCDHCSRIEKIWAKGIVYQGQLENDSSSYIAGYITKTSAAPTCGPGCYDDGAGTYTSRISDNYYDYSREEEEWKSQNRREREFARMSCKPGIGATFIPEVASVLLGLNPGLPTTVPTSIRIGSRVQPLGRYLTRQLRKHCGLPENAPQEVLDEMEAKMLPLRQAAQNAPKGTRKEAFKSLILDMNEQSFRNAMVRFRRKNPGGKIRETLEV